MTPKITVEKGPPMKPSHPCLLGRQLDERRASKEESKHVCHDVIADYHRHRNQKPANKTNQELITRKHNKCKSCKTTFRPLGLKS
jgi:hypothetical protein